MRANQPRDISSAYRAGTPLETLASVKYEPLSLKVDAMGERLRGEASDADATKHKKALTAEAARAVERS